MTIRQAGFFAAWVVAAGLAPAGAGAAERLLVPRFEFARYGFTADALDATGIFLNPAGLAGGPGTNLYADLTGHEDGIVEYTAGMQGKGLGFFYRHRERLGPGELPAEEQSVTDGGDLDSYILAAGYGPPKLKLGVSAVWNKTTLPGDDGFSWNAGLQSVLSPRVTVGGLLENIQHPDFLGGELRPRYTYGARIRFLSGRVSANIQGSHLDGASDVIAMQYGVRVAMKAGHSVSAVMSDRPGEAPTFGLSGTWFFGRGTVSARGHSLTGNHELLGQAAIQIFDEFWQQATQPPAPPRIGRRR